MASRITRHPSIAPAHPGEQLEEIVIPSTGRSKSEIARLLGISSDALRDHQRRPAHHPVHRRATGQTVRRRPRHLAAHAGRPRRLGGRTRDRRQRHSDPACEQVMSNADDVIAADIMAVNAIIFRVTPSYRNSQFHLHQGIRSKNSNENLPPRCWNR